MLTGQPAPGRLLLVPFSSPHSLDEYRQLVVLLDNLIDEGGEDETHLLASLMEIVGVLIQNYETEHVPELMA